ncbi:hypothetical protein RUM43_013380 [Polyplax serrata]|uniref:Dynein axonemal assembly factor 1 homolog n=1 Tax=Polyplax serrata TaxID=468196 RepID=A0AAN8P532_POLSC
MLTGLTKLQLCNNLIEKIENLEVLVNLEELDLSFNYIERIENLDTLTNLEVLTLFQNRIKVLENMKCLSNLTVFSIGNNFITDQSNVLYLRTFAKLKSLNMAGNPICEEDNFVKYIIAYLPNLVYYEYRMVTKAEKETAREMFLSSLIKLEREEQEALGIEIVRRKEEEEEFRNANAFVEYIGGNHLFSALFDKDTDCKTLMEMGDNVIDLYNEYKKNFIEVASELVTFGLAQLELRKAEIARFEKYIGQAKKGAFEQSRTIVEDFIEQKNSLFEQISEVLSKEVEDDEVANEVSLRLQVLNEAFRDLCHRTWTILMRKELNLFEGSDEVNGTYERCLTELVNQFIEGCQAQFTQLRQLQGVFNESLTDAANKFFTNYTVSTATGQPNMFSNISKELANQMMQDKEALVNALSTSHDYHLLVIDQREDKLVTKVRGWLSNLVENLIGSEISRHRNTIMEINYFLDIQKSELQELLTTPVGLHLLPKEIQDALQM